MELNTNTTATATINTEEGENVNNIEFVEEEVEEENENLTVNDVVIDKKAVQLMHSCPIWVKMSEIPHPALVPGFISRRECLQDGSLDPTTSSVPTQVSLLSASTLSPSLIQVVSNIPTGLMLESVHKRNLKDELREEMVPCVLGSYTPAHYVRTSDPTLLTAVSSSSSSASNTHVSVAQTAAELSAMNILYGGVKGKAYLESLEDFVDGISLPENDSTIRPIIMSKLEGIRSACGYKILNMDDDKKVPFNITEVNQIISSTTPDVESFDSLTRENDSILTILGRSASVDEVNRTALLERLGVNLRALIKLCPDEIRNGELFKGVDMNLDKYNLSKKLIN